MPLMIFVVKVNVTNLLNVIWLPDAAREMAYEWYGFFSFNAFPVIWGLNNNYMRKSIKRFPILTLIVVLLFIA